jgi:Protein of unknown function (DUF3592)
MKVLKVLGLVFGILILLTGGGLLAGSFLVDKGANALQGELEKQGLKGPVNGTVKSIDQTLATVSYKDLSRKSRTGSGPVLSQPGPKVGDTVTVYYESDDPTQIVVANVPGGDLSKIGSSLRLGGIVALIVGGVMILASILGFIFGKKKPPVTQAAPAPSYATQGAAPQGYPPAPQSYPAQSPPAQGWAQQPPQGGYPQQQPPQGYPQQQPPQGYPQQNWPGQQGGQPPQR